MKRIVVFIFTAISFHFGFAQVISGTTPVTVGQVKTYSLTTSTLYGSYVWYLSNADGNVTAPTRTLSGGLYTYGCTITWTTAGTSTLTFSGNGTTVATFFVTIQCPTLSTPNATFTYSTGTTACGSVTISYTASPPTGATWYWQTSTGGTSVANSSKSFIAFTSQTYYLRANCLNTWSNNAQSTSAVTVKTMPTVAATNPSICSGTGTNVVLTNNVPSATNTWTVPPTNGMGATNNSGISGNSSPYTYTLNQTLTNSSNITNSVVYTITPSANGCTGIPITVTATVKPIPSASASNQTICSGSTAVINLTTNNVSGATYTWSVSQALVTGATTPGSLATSTSQTLTNSGNVPGTANYSIVPAYSGCTGTTLNVVVNVNSLPVISINNLSPTICSGASTNISYSSAVSGTTFTWGITPSNVNGALAQVTPVSSGTIHQALSTPNGVNSGSVSYNFQSSATFVNGGTCTSSNVANVIVNQVPTISAPDQKICSGSTAAVNLTTNNVSGANYAWSVSQTNVSGATTPGPTITSTNQTLYTTTLVPGSASYTIIPSANGCTGSTLAVAVTVNPIPTISLNNLSPTICSGAFTNITFSSAVSGTTFTWGVSPSNVTGALAQTMAISAGTISQVLSNQDGVTPGSTTSYNFISSVTFANGGTCSSNAPTSVTVNPKPVATQLNKTFFAGSSISVPLSSNVSGSTYSYTVATASNATGSSSGNSNPLAQPLALSDAINWGSVTYVVTPTAYGCTGTAANTVVALYPQPGITSSSPSVYMGLHAILTSQSFYDSYNWSGSSGSIAGGSSISIAKADTYTLTVVKNGTTSPNMATITIIDQFNGQNLNYFTSNSLQVATSDTSRIKLLPVDSLQQSIQYFDGLGRTMQQVVTQGSPSKADVIQPVAYDAYGRQNKNYLPFTNGNNGWYKQNPVGAIPGDSTSAQYLFYNNGPADKIIDDKRPFNETIFESSAANRTLKNYGPGSAWGPAPVGNDKYVVHQYLVNQHGTAVGQEMVIAWQFNSSTGLPEKSTSSNTTYIATGGYYASNQLNIKVTVDENGNATREYSDKQGRVVLKKVQVVAGSTDLTNPAQWASTYYVYDDFGNLVVVLPPEGVNAFNAQN